MITRTLLVIVVLLSCIQAAEQIVILPPGQIKLLDGYKHQSLTGMDSLIGIINKQGGVDITYDIGKATGNFASRIDKEKQVWSLSQVVNGRQVLIVKKKDGRVVISFDARKNDKDSEYPANFSAKISSEEELAIMLAMCLTYPSNP